MSVKAGPTRVGVSVAWWKLGATRSGQRPGGLLPHTPLILLLLILSLLLLFIVLLFLNALILMLALKMKNQLNQRVMMKTLAHVELRIKIY